MDVCLYDILLWSEYWDLRNVTNLNKEYYSKCNVILSKKYFWKDKIRQQCNYDVLKEYTLKEYIGLYRSLSSYGSSYCLYKFDNVALSNERSLAAGTEWNKLGAGLFSLISCDALNLLKEVIMRYGITYKLKSDYRSAFHGSFSIKCEKWIREQLKLPISYLVRGLIGRRCLKVIGFKKVLCYLTSYGRQIVDDKASMETLHSYFCNLILRNKIQWARIVLKMFIESLDGFVRHLKRFQARLPII